MTSAPPTDNRPIGIFDSGIGGLTVLRSLLPALPQESFIYLGDTARLPYGSKSPQTIERYLVQNIRFLRGLGVKAVVVACNTASTVMLDRDLSSFASDIPLYNVIEPGAEEALRVSTTKRIGVLGTAATINAGAYAKSLHRLDQTTVVFSQACPLLVPLVEEGWEDDPLTNLVIYRYVAPVLANTIDTLILGCTHYPALRGGIARVAGNNIQLVDSAQAIVRKLTDDFARGELHPAAPKPADHANPSTSLRILTTDPSPSFAQVAGRLMHPHVLPELESADLGDPTFSA